MAGGGYEDEPELEDVGEEEERCAAADGLEGEDAEDSVGEEGGGYGAGRAGPSEATQRNVSM